VELLDDIRAAILPLIALLNDGDNDVCAAAAKTLGSFAAHGKLHMTIASIRLTKRCSRAL